MFAQRSAGFEELVGDYSALPSTYLPEDYARDTQGLNVVGTVWAEFISDNPADEVRWANELMHAATRPTGMIALVDFLSPDLKHTLDAYASTQHVRCVRQHMGWHPENPLLRYAQRPDLLSDPAWRRGIDLLRGRGLLCEIEIFAPQLREFASVAAAYPDIQFVLPVMGWPVDLTRAGQATSKCELAAVGKCPNVAIKIFRWNASSVSTGRSPRCARGSFRPSRFWAPHAVCSRVTCRSASSLAAFNIFMVRILR